MENQLNFKHEAFSSIVPIVRSDLNFCVGFSGALRPHPQEDQGHPEGDCTILAGGVKNPKIKLEQTPKRWKLGNLPTLIVFAF